MSKESELFAALRAGDVPRVRGLLKPGFLKRVPYVNTREGGLFNYTPLELAISEGPAGPGTQRDGRLVADLVKLLLDHGANPEDNSEGQAPLLLITQAAWRLEGVGVVEVVQALLSCGANPNVLDESSGWSTPLFRACDRPPYPGQDEVRRLLVQHGARHTVFTAAAAGDTAYLGWYLGHSDPNVCLPNGFTPLHAACSRGRQEAVQLLLGHGAHVNARCDGVTPLTMCLDECAKFPSDAACAAMHLIESRGGVD